MKKSILFLALLQLIIINVYSQQIDQDSLDLIELEQSKTKTIEEAPVFIVVEQMPEYPGGTTLRDLFIQNNLKSEFKNLEQYNGKSLIVTFIVEKDGSLSSIEVLKGIDKNINDEIMRVIKGMPLWLPGKQNNVKVRVRFSIPILF